MLSYPQNCEIPPKSQIFSKTPARFAHWGDQNLKPIQINRARRALSNGYDFIWFESLDPLRKGKSTSQCWVCFFVKALFFFLKNMKIALTGPFSEEYYITEETGEKCVLHIFFGLCCFPFICQRTGSERHHSIYYFITFGGISQFWVIWKYGVWVEISPFDRARLALSV